MENFLENFSAAEPFNSWWPLIIAIIVGVITTIRGYSGGVPCPSQATICGKTVLITGGSSGIGLHVVLELLNRGGRVIVGSRCPEIAFENIDKAMKKNNKKFKESDILIEYLDLTCLREVRKFVEKIANEPKIDILINNAGVAFQDFQMSDEGLETHFVTNYLSHFLLTHLLMPKLKAAKNARIINVSAPAHYAGDLFLDDMNLEMDYTYNKAFAQSKLALVMMARHMDKILRGSNITINAMHPGIVRNTNLFKKSPMFNSFIVKVAVCPWAWLLTKSPEQGAQTIIYMSVATELENVSGKYFSNCKVIEPSEKAMNEAMAEKLYQKSLELAGLTGKEEQISFISATN